MDDGLTDIDPLDYEEILGEKGMAVLRKPAVEAWRGNRCGWVEKYLMERLAKVGGDVDAMIAIYAAGARRIRDLPEFRGGSVGAVGDLAARLCQRSPHDR